MKKPMPMKPNKMKMRMGAPVKKAANGGLMSASLPGSTKAPVSMPGTKPMRPAVKASAPVAYDRSTGTPGSKNYVPRMQVRSTGTPGSKNYVPRSPIRSTGTPGSKNYVPRSLGRPIMPGSKVRP